MPAVVEEMERQQGYYKATCTSIKLLLRLAKKNCTVLAWLHDHRERLRWMQVWLETNPQPPGYGSPLRLYKRVVTGGGRGAQEAAGEPQALQWQAEIGLLLRGLPVVPDGYDSDEDPQSLLGRRLRMLWARNKWYVGRVLDWNAVRKEHVVRYEDGDQKWYDLRKRVFVFMEEGEEFEDGTVVVPFQ
jgi:hypothetical protein